MLLTTAISRGISPGVLVRSCYPGEYLLYDGESTPDESIHGHKTARGTSKFMVSDAGVVLAISATNSGDYCKVLTPHGSGWIYNSWLKVV